MSGFNHLIVAGNLGQDAEITPVGAQQTPKVTFSLAVDTGRGEQATTEWFACVFWGERAAKVAPFLTKGLRLVVEGRLQTRSWDDEQGVRRYRTELIVSAVALRGYSRVVVMGHLGADAELHYLGESGTPCLNFRLGVTTGSGEHQRTEWVPVTVYGKRAEPLAEFLVKGAKVLVSGARRTAQWESAQGETRRRTELIVAPYQGDVVFMGQPGAAHAATPEPSPADDGVLDYPG